MLKKRFKRWDWRFVLPVFLLVANGVAWFMFSGQTELVLAEPILHEHIAEVRQHWQAGDAVGETFELTVTNMQAMETVTWFLDGRGVPFTHPQVEIYPDYVRGGGNVKVLGSEVYVSGEARIYLENGRLEPEILNIGVGNASAPQFVLDMVDRGLVIYDNLQLPIEILEVEQREGEVYLRGVYTQR